MFYIDVINFDVTVLVTGRISKQFKYYDSFFY